MPERTFETVGPARDPAGSRNKGALVFLVDDYLGKFSFDIFRSQAVDLGGGREIDELSRPCRASQSTAESQVGTGDLLRG
jgi:hypothetical protein